MRKSCRECLENGAIPEFYHIHLDHLCYMAIEPTLLGIGDSEGDGYRIIFVRAYLTHPGLFLKLMARVRTFYERKSPIWKALRLQPWFKFEDAEGRIVGKSFDEMSSSDIRDFIKQEYGDNVTLSAINRCCERLAEEDLASWKAGVDGICSFFHGNLQLELRQRLLASPPVTRHR